MRCFRGGLTLSVLKIPFRVFSSNSDERHPGGGGTGTESQLGGVKKLASSGWSWNKLWPDPLEFATRLTFPAPRYPLALVLCFSRLFGFVFSFLISEDVSFHHSS